MSTIPIRVSRKAHEYLLRLAKTEDLTVAQAVDKMIQREKRNQEWHEAGNQYETPAAKPLRRTARLVSAAALRQLRGKSS